MELRILTESFFYAWILCLLFVSPFRVIRRKYQASFYERMFFMIVSSTLLLLTALQVADNKNEKFFYIIFIFAIFSVGISLLSVINYKHILKKEKRAWHKKTTAELKSKIGIKIDEYLNNFFKIL